MAVRFYRTQFAPRDLPEAKANAARQLHVPHDT
jgi:hypothetical protein